MVRFYNIGYKLYEMYQTVRTDNKFGFKIACGNDPLVLLDVVLAWRMKEI